MSPCLVVTKSSPPLGGSEKANQYSPIIEINKICMYIDIDKRAFRYLWGASLGEIKLLALLFAIKDIIQDVRSVPHHPRRTFLHS